MLQDHKIINFNKLISSLPDQPNIEAGMTADELKAWFDSSPEELKQSLNDLIDELVSTSGAAGIGVSSIPDLPGADVQEVVQALKTQIDNKDAQNVKLTGNQTIADVKTFASSPVVPTPTTDMQVSTKKYVDDTDAARKVYVDGLDVQNVKLTGNQTITDVKTFASSPVVPTPTTAMQASTKKYVDDSNLGNVDLTTDQQIGGIKEFIFQPRVPYPAGVDDAASKKYVDDTVGGAILGQLADGSITDVKLSNDAGQIKQRVANLESVRVTSVSGRSGDVVLTKSDVGLANVDNTSDANKPVSTAQQTALNLKANLASPTFTGTPAGPTPTATTNTTQFATTAYVRANRLIGSITVTNASWVASGNALLPFKKNQAITGVVAADTPSSFAFTLATLGVAQDANIGYVECYAGGVTLYAESVPTGSVTADYVITKG